MFLTSLLPHCTRVQGVVVFLVFAIVVVVVAAVNVNCVFRSGSSCLLGHICLLGCVSLIVALIHIGRLSRQDSKFVTYIDHGKNAVHTKANKKGIE